MFLSGRSLRLGLLSVRGGLLLVLLLRLSQLLRQELLQLRILELLLGLDQLGLVPYWRVGKENGTSREESNGEVEAGDEGVRGGVTISMPSSGATISINSTIITSSVKKGINAHDFVRLDEGMLDGLLQTHTSPLLILQYTDVEGEMSGLLLHLREDSTRCLHF